MEERTYVTRVQVDRLVKRLMPFQDQLATLHRRLDDIDGGLNHMYLEVVVPWIDPPRNKYTSEVVDVEALNFLVSCGAFLVATFVDIADQLDEGLARNTD
jgi:hypothetical protein